jgi:hypothetical protein
VTKLLEILLDDVEYETIRRVARRDNVTVATWVRNRLRQDLHEGSAADRASRLAAIEVAYETNSARPAADIDEIERGHLAD